MGAEWPPPFPRGMIAISANPAGPLTRLLCLCLIFFSCPALNLGKGLHHIPGRMAALRSVVQHLTSCRSFVTSVHWTTQLSTFPPLPPRLTLVPHHPLPLSCPPHPPLPLPFPIPVPVSFPPVSWPGLPFLSLTQNTVRSPA